MTNTPDGVQIMTKPAPVEISAFNAMMIEEFRANEGRVSGPFAGTPMILIHHIGARSGIERVTPLACSPQADGQFAIVAANGGAPAHPGCTTTSGLIPGSPSR
jgi:F420H(2)-dependent quinone reductase